MLIFIAVIYLLIGLMAAYFIAGYAAWISAGRNDWLCADDVGWGIFIGALTIVTWPIAAPWAGLYWLAHNGAWREKVLWKPPSKRGPR